MFSSNANQPYHSHLQRRVHSFWPIQPFVHLVKVVFRLSWKISIPLVFFWELSGTSDRSQHLCCTCQRSAWATGISRHGSNISCLIPADVLCLSLYITLWIKTLKTLPADVSRLCHEHPILFEGWNLRRLTLSSRLPCHVFYIRNTNQLSDQLGVVPLGVERHLMFWLHFQEMGGQLFSFTQIHFNIFGINLGKAVSHQSLFRILMFQSFMW